MPIYEYMCESCKKFEYLSKNYKDKLTTCPTCGNSVKQLISAGSFIFCGQGTYTTDYVRNKNKKDPRSMNSKHSATPNR